MHSNEGQPTPQQHQKWPVLNPIEVRTRTVTASPLLFSMVIVSAIVWLILIWMISLDYILTKAAPSATVEMCFFVLTVLITFAVMINRYVFFSPDNQVVVEDRLFGQVMYRRSLTLMSSEDVKVEIFAGSWYVFVTNYGVQPQLITHARADSQLAMELVVMFEEHNSAMPEATA